MKKYLFAGLLALGMIACGQKNATMRYPQMRDTTFGLERLNTEGYKGISENVFEDSRKNPLSTFSIDVDAASYSNVRRFIRAGERPPKDAVRIEELVNYFHYEYPEPTADDPFSVTMELSSAPWNDQHKLALIGIQGKRIAKDKLPASNLVFLIDVSGSMAEPNKLPLLMTSFKMLVEQMRKEDRVAIVTYAGTAGLALPSTSGEKKEAIMEALDNLGAGGSTAGSAGIRLAYQISKENYISNGNNRVILATDGDFNVGESSDGALQQLIEEKRSEGVFLTVMGFGSGNLKDSKMEALADKGNGNYLYIDSILEAQKALVSEFGGTLFTIARDVKLQVEFNPAMVKAYRLIGYENRLLHSEDFNNDKKDAGELGAGHTVTALYEIIPVGVDSKFFSVDDLKYQSSQLTPKALDANDLVTVKIRFKKPDNETSDLITETLTNDELALENASNNFRWAATVAAFGMSLRQSEYLNGFSDENIEQLGKSARGADEDGYRSEFLSLVRAMRALPVQ